MTKSASTVSRQRKYQLKNLHKGLCPQCGKERKNYVTRCDSCALKFRRLRRKFSGCKAHVEGGVGAPPKIPDDASKNA